MTIRSFASLTSANGSWIGFAVLFPIGAALLAAAASHEIRQVLLALADTACAACVDARNGMPAGPFTAGLLGAGAAASGLWGPSNWGQSSGGNVPKYPYSRDTLREPWKDKIRDDEAAEDVGDVTPRRPPERRRLLEASERIQKWAEGWVGVEEKGTAPTAHLM